MWRMWKLFHLSGEGLAGVPQGLRPLDAVDLASVVVVAEAEVEVILSSRKVIIQLVRMHPRKLLRIQFKTKLNTSLEKL